jgi:protein-disulfide isomerase
MSRLRPPIGPQDHVLGSPRAPVTLVEFGDYECPFCGEAFHVVRALEEALRERLCFVFRNFPLAGRHRSSPLAAEAAEAAGAQGKFWPMHDTLYQHQNALALPDLMRYAARLGLDEERFAGDLREHRHREKLRADLRSGAVSGVSGTPTFFINGFRYDGSWDFDALWSAIAGTAGAAPGFY